MKDCIYLFIYLFIYFFFMEKIVDPTHLVWSIFKTSITISNIRQKKEVEFFRTMHLL